MFTPYDWQEGIGNRAQFIEGKLAQGAPVLAVSLDAGILVFTYRRQARKIYEIYDRLIFAGIGQQSDVEALRVAALEFASKEGYSRSEEDVTIQRVATAISAPMKRAFSDFNAAPIVARSLFGEVNTTPADDLYYALDYDGDYTMSRNAAVIAGTLDAADALRDHARSRHRPPPRSLALLLRLRIGRHPRRRPERAEPRGDPSGAERRPRGPVPDADPGRVLRGLGVRCSEKR
jgi:proteasome alpha subunit